MNQKVSALLTLLLAYQIRAKLKDPRKALKRLVVGVREVQRSVARGKSKCVIVAFNLERSGKMEANEKASIDDRKQKIWIR